MPIYKRLSERPKKNVDQLMPLVDIVILSESNNPLLKECITSFKKHAQGLGSIYIIENSSLHNKSCIKKITPSGACLKFLLTKTDIAQQIKLCLENKNHYVLFAQDTDILTTSLNLMYCAKQLEKTKAHAFYFSYDLDVFGGIQQSRSSLTCEQIVEDIYAWKFSCYEPCLNSFSSNF